MKILLIQPTGDKYGHYGTYFINVAQGLCDLGHKVTIFTNKMDVPSSLTENPLFSIVEYKNGSFEFCRFEKNKVSQPFKYWFNYFYLSYKITWNGLLYGSINGFSTIYISDAEFLMASIALKFYTGKKIPILMQINASNFSFQEYPGSFTKKAYKSFQSFWFRRALKRYISGISILGDWHKPRLRKQLNIDQNFKIFKIPDGAKQYDVLTSKKCARSKIGIDYYGDLLLFSGILRIDKGLEVLADAIKDLFEDGERFKIIIAGHPFDYSEKQVRDLFNFGERHNENVILRLSYIPDEELVNYFCGADALLLPYNLKYKGSTGPLMKGACTFGLPVILSNHGEMGYLAKSNDLGYLFETESAQSLADAIRTFLNSSVEDRTQKTKNAMKLGRLNSWELVARAFEDAFIAISHFERGKEENEQSKYS